MKNTFLCFAVLCAFALSLGSSAFAERKSTERDAALAKTKAKPAAPKQETAPTAPSTSKPVDQPTTSTPVQETTTSTQPQVVTSTPTQPAVSAASPMAGEQIKWQVLSGGGVSSSSASYKMSASVGLTAAGPVSSASYLLNQGYWQNFSTASGCCIGTTGNVNKSVAETPDLSDLSLLISYLTVLPRPVLPCPEEANVNGSVAVTPDLSDLSLLISYLTVLPRPTLPNCP
jgi:hypothetical protein